MYAWATETNAATASWICARFGVYSRGSLLIAVFLGPVALNRNALDAFALQKLTALWIFGLLALALYIVWAAERRVWVPPARVLVAAAAFLGAFVLATVFSQAPLTSLLGLEGRYGGLFSLLALITILLVIVALYWDRPNRIREIAWAVALGSLVLASYVIIQQAGLDPIPWIDSNTGRRTPYPFGTMGNSNFAGACLGIGLPPLIYLVATIAPKRRPLLVFALGLQVLALWYTQSRGAFLAAFMGLVAGGFLLHGRMSRRTKLISFASMAAAIMVLVGALLWRSGEANPPGATEKVRLLETTTAESRLHYWTAAWRVFLEHPIVGTGPDTFYATYPAHRVASTGADPNESNPDKPHNVFVEYAANTGVLGLGTYLAMVGMALWHGARRCRMLTGEPQLLLAAFVAMLVAYLAQAAVSIDVHGLVATGWVAMGAIAAMADPAVLSKRGRLRASSLTEAGRAPVSRTRILRAVTGLALVGLLVLGLRIMRADVNAGLRNFARAGELNPIQAAYPGGEGLDSLTVAKATSDPLGKVRYLELTRDRLERALHIQPDLTKLMPVLAETYTVWAESGDPLRYGDAILWWQRALDLDPKNVGLLRAFEDARRRMDDYVAQLESRALASPEDAATWLQVAKGRMGLSDPDQAKVALERVLKLEPGNREAKDLLANLPQ